MGILYVVATPIGNLEDISLRAARALLTAEIIACEDTRKTGILLKEIAKLFSGYTERQKPTLISYFDQKEQYRIPEIVSLLTSGKDVFLTSDAGTPTISDPGFKLVRECIAQGIQVVAIPGPSAAIAALSIAGLPTDRFLFVGYPPKKEGHRKTFWEELRQAKEIVRATIILYEAPHRIVATLQEMISVFGESQHVVLARELTKIYEETRRGTLPQLLSHFKTVEPKGEFVILL